MTSARLIIGAPFGNYLHPPGALPTLGTFTLEPRPGRWKQVLKTVRRANGGWINQLGLRNPGIESYRQNYSQRGGHILSIHGFNPEEWKTLYARLMVIPGPQLIELNVSCPNVEDADSSTGFYRDLFERFVTSFPNTIVKLPPVNYNAILGAAFSKGVRNFHCSNTIPTPVGAVSGKPLKPLSLQVVKTVRAMSDMLTIIGGGGITSEADMGEYATAGADYFAIASGWFNPLTLVRINRLAAAANSFRTVRTLEHD